MRKEIRNRSLILSSFLLAIFFSFPIWGEGPVYEKKDRFYLEERMDGVSLLPYLSVYQDTTGKKSFKEVLKIFDQGGSEKVTQNSLGYSKSAIWVRLKTENQTNKPLDWILEIDYALLDYVDLFVGRVSDSAVNHSGDLREFGTRPIEHRNFAYPFSDEPGSKREIYFRIASSSSILLPFLAFSKNEFIEHSFTEQLALGLYYGSMMIMVVYNLFLLFSTKDKSYLYYVIYILTYILFQFTLNGLSFQYLWRSSVLWANYSLPFSIFTVILTAGAFSRSFLNAPEYTPRTSKLYYLLFALSFGGMVSTLFIWEYRTAIMSSLVLMFFTLGFLISNGIQCLVAGRREAKYFLFAWSSFLFFSFLFGLKSFGILPNNFFTLWGIQVGSVMEVTLLSLGLADRIKGLSDQLKQRVEELGKIRNYAEESEAKYRSLFEVEEDFLFSLDQNWNILAANKSVSKHIGFKPQEVIGKNFMELIYKAGELQDAYKKLYVLEKLEELASEGKPVRFLGEFLQKYLREPKELQVQFQILEYEGQREILGRAYEPDQDLMSRYVDDEKTVYSANNYLQNAELLSQRMTTNLYRFVDPGTITAMRNCLREMIINAIEHGNLNISFEEKTRAMSEGNYFRFVQERQKDPYYKSKKVKVEYSLSRDRIGVRITDEGKGFNHARLQKSSMEKLNSEGITHGRGLTLTLATFDLVKFNSTGNQVTLVKYF